MVEPLVEVSLDQQGGSMRGTLAVRVPPGHPPPRMVPVVKGLLLWCCCCCSAPGVSPQGLNAPRTCARLPGLVSWVGVVYGSTGKVLERFARGFSTISCAATTLSLKEHLC